jgi:Acyl carrier protein
MGEIKSRKYQELGIGSLTDQEGLETLELCLGDRYLEECLPVSPRAWASWKDSPWKNWSARNGQVLENRQTAVEGHSRFSNHSGKTQEESVTAPLLKEITRLFAEELRVEPERMKPDTRFEEFGVDSVLLAELVQRMDREWNIQLSPEILIEAPTLRKLADRLLQDFPQLGEAAGSAEEDVAVAPENVQNGDQVHSSVIASRGPNNNQPDEPIAVIGFAGDFPGASDVNQFWRNLTQVSMVSVKFLKIAGPC